MYGGNGADTFVLRAGDGNSNITLADIIADFEDGTDVIGMDGLGFDDLTITQGTSSNASHTIIQYTSTSEYLAIIQNITVGNITALDFTSTSTDAQTLTGTSGNNTLIGGAGVDTVNGGAGSDTVYSWGGNDTINITSKTGAFTDTINGGAGTDTLNINYSGITSLIDFTISKSGDTTTLIDSSSGTINFESIENLTVGSYDYINTGSDNDGYNVVNGYWNSTEGILYLFNGGNLSLPSTAQFDQLFGQHQTEITSDFKVLGSELSDTLNLNVNRSGDFETISGDYTLIMYAGNDTLNSAKLKNGDSIDMGSGDDIVSLMLSGSYGTPTIANANFTKLDGGSGTDTLSFEESTVDSGSTLSLTIGGATNFENLTGSASIETLNGDTNANTIKGNGGADTLYGNAGNDILFGHAQEWLVAGASSQSGDDNLYGGAGDDQLYGTAGENILDGGTGKDTMYGGNGADTFVLRAGDGNSNITLADIIADFEDGTDVIGMDDGLQYSDLTVIQGSGSNSNDTLVSITSTGEYLAIVESMSATALTEVDFTPVDIL
jgi:Ca2+-binding RTX toxin-like protein